MIAAYSNFPAFALFLASQGILFILKGVAIWIFPNLLGCKAISLSLPFNANNVKDTRADLRRSGFIFIVLLLH